MLITGRYPSLPYVLPFVILIAALVLLPLLPVSPRTEAAIRVALLALTILIVAKPVLSFRLVAPMASIGMGLLVFVVWIGPDLLMPGWHQLPLFSNGITGSAESAFPVEARGDAMTLFLRIVRAAVLVPIIEELFWRGWLPRWMLGSDFTRVPLGRYTPMVFVVTAVLFASEHGAFWDVGLAAGMLYNLWMWRTRSLGDCILAHAVTNGALAAWVLLTGAWEYW